MKGGKMMKKLSFVIIGLILTLSGPAYAYKDGDFQVWNTDVEEFKINNDLKIAAEEEFRWGDNADEFYYHHYDAGVFYNIEKYFNVGAGYRYIYELKRGDFKIENEPYVTAALTWDWKGFKFEDRNRMEYRHFNYQADAGRFRNKLTMKLPWKFTKLELQPYLSDEALIGFGTTNQFNQNRFSSGFSMDLTKHIKGELYYMLQTTKSSGIWSDVNVAGTKLKIAF